MKRGVMMCFCVSILVLNSAYAGDDYARLNGWDFDNWSTGTATWDLFKRTFIGVRDDDLMDVAHWELYDPNVTGKGHCFGMCLLSLAILKEDGHMGFCKPPYIYDGTEGPDDPELDTAITILHGHQFGHTMINWMTERIMSGELTNGKTAYDDVEYYLSMDDPPIISIIVGEGSGHAMVPYRCEEISSSEWRIYVYDPNRPYRVTSDYYDLDSNYIKIEAAGPHYEWAFEMDGGTMWEGDNSGIFKTFIFAYPFSEVLQPQRNPFELGAVLEDLNEVFVGGDARITQLSNDKGERLYKSGIHDPAAELEDHPEKRINNVIAFPFVGGGDGNPDAYIVKEHTDNDLKIDVESTGECYRFFLTGNGRLIKVEARSGLPGNDVINIRSINTAREELTVVSERGQVQLTIELLRPGQTLDETRTYRICDLWVSKAAPVSVRMTEDGDALMVKSMSPVQCDVEIVKSTDDGKQRLEQKEIVLSTSWQKLTPTDWNNLRDAHLCVQ